MTDQQNDLLWKLANGECLPKDAGALWLAVQKRIDDAKKLGAAEELERMAMWARSVALVDDAEPGDWRDTLARITTRRAAEIRKEIA